MKGVIDQLSNEFPTRDISNNDRFRFVLEYIGQTINSLPEKAIIEHDFLILFAKLSEYLEGKLKLDSRILIIKILQIAAVTLSKRQYNTQVITAISIICGQYENECEKERPNIGFLITILDAFQIFGMKKIGDLKDIVDCLAKIKDVAPRLDSYRRNCLRIALDKDTEPFQNSRQFENQIRATLDAYGSKIKATKSRPIGQIPTRQQDSLEKRILIQETIKNFPIDTLLDLIQHGLMKLKVSPTYEIPEKINNVITDLVNLEKIDMSAAQIDPHQNNIETSVYIISQGLENMVPRMKFTSQKVQSQFLAMMITTVDRTLPDSFLQCRGPCTEIAIAKATNNLKQLRPFLDHWINYEYVRSPKERYHNLCNRLLIEICEHLAKDDIVLENPFRVFFNQIPLIDNSVFDLLSNEVNQKPAIASIVINNMTQVAVKYPQNQEKCLHVVQSLCTSADPQIRQISIDTAISLYYIRRTFSDEMEKFAIEQLHQAADKQTVEEASRYIQYYFEIMKKNGALLPDLMDVYGKMNSEIQNEVRTLLQSMMSDIGFNLDALKNCFARKTPDNIKLIHFILRMLANIGTGIPADLSNIIYKEYKETKDARFIIPIIPSLSDTDFFKLFPEILRLNFSAIKEAIKMYFTTKKKNEDKSKVDFLNVIHAQPISDASFAKNIPKTITYCVSLDKLFPYQLVAASVQLSMRNGNIDFVCDTLAAILTFYRAHANFVLQLFPELTNKGICDSAAWPSFMNILYKTIPNSFKYAYSLPTNKLQSLLHTYPDLIELMLNDTSKKKVSRKVVAAIKEVAAEFEEQNPEAETKPEE